MLKKRDLILFDLGYFSLCVLSQIIEKGAFFLSRYLQGTTLYIKHSSNGFQCLDLISLLQKYKNSAVIELAIHLGATQKVPSRFIAVKLPPNQINAKIRKARKRALKRGLSLSKAQRSLASWNIYVTNVSSDVISANEISQVYRLRWSVELLFKQFKSTMQLHVWNHGNQFRLQCEIIGTLIVAAIIMSLHGITQNWLWKQDFSEISFEKLFKLCKDNAGIFFDAISLSATNIKRIFQDLLRRIRQSCIKDSRQNRPSSLLVVATKYSITKITFLSTRKLIPFGL